MSRRSRNDYLGVVEIEVPRWLALLMRAPRRVRLALRRAYLRSRIKSAEIDALRHEWHAANEPRLAAAARSFAEELRVELATLTPPKGNT